MATNLKIIINLLNDAFGPDDITELALTQFPTVYENFTAGMSKRQQLQQIVAEANRATRIPDLVSYLQTQRRLKYAEYAAQLEPLLQTTGGRSLQPTFIANAPYGLEAANFPVCARP